jgi:Flp pilus assembly protein TadD
VQILNIDHSHERTVGWDAAIDAFDEAIRLKPDFPEAHDILKDARQQKGQREKAIAAYNALFQLRKNDPQFHYDLGCALWQWGSEREGIAACREALRLRPGDPVIQNELAYYLTTSTDPSLRNTKQALNLARKATSHMLGSKQPTHWNVLGQAHYRDRNWKEALAALDKAVELRGTSTSADGFLRAMAHWQLGNKEQAREDYARAVAWMEKHEPKNGSLRRLRAEAAELLGISDARPRPSKEESPNKR